MFIFYFTSGGKIVPISFILLHFNFRNNKIGWKISSSYIKPEQTLFGDSQININFQPPHPRNEIGDLADL